MENLKDKIIPVTTINK